MDSKQTGGIDYEEFRNFVDSGEKNDQEDLREAFNILDVDGTGKVTIDQLIKGFQNLGEVLDQEEAQRLMNEANLSGDQDHLNFEEFTRLMNTEHNGEFTLFNH